MKFVPVNTYIVVKKAQGTYQSAGGIVLTTAEDADHAIVVAKSDLVSFVEVGEELLVRWSKALKIDDQHFAVDAADIVTKIIK